MSHMSFCVCYLLQWHARKGSTCSVEPNALWSILASPIHVFTRAHSRLLKKKSCVTTVIIVHDETYTMKVGIAIDLDASEEQSSVQEDPVTLPSARVVVRLSIHSPWHGPDSSSSHFIYLLILSKINNYYH